MIIYIFFNIMLSMFSYIYNYSWVTLLHNLLTNFNNNYCFLLIIMIFLKNFFFLKNYYFYISFILLCKLNFNYIDMIALHNTLFIYHPIILYTIVLVVVINLKVNNKLSFIFVTLGWVSFILGGYWASQEFNWGGWWNWDSLEMGVLFTLLYFLIKLHLKLAIILIRYVNEQLVFFIIFYWMFNKLGITISIHSFVKNTFLLKYSLIFFCIIFLFNFSIFNFVICILLMQLKYIFISIVLWKLIIFMLLIYWLFLLNFKHIIVGYIHRFYSYIIFFFFFINLNNQANYKFSSINFNLFMFSFNYFKIIFTNFNNINMNLLKKNFFFFKFFNNHYINFGWFFNLNNTFSTTSWILTFIMLKKYTKYYTKLHKKRIFNKSIITFNYVNNINFCKKKKIIYIYFYKTFFLKFKFFRKLRKLLRKKLKKKYLQIFFFCKPNFLIHEKFKNARMGKGKGSPTIWVLQPNLTHPTFIFKNFSLKRATLVKLFLQQYFNPYLIMKLI